MGVRYKSERSVWISPLVRGEKIGVMIIDYILYVYIDKCGLHYELYVIVIYNTL